MNVAICRSNHAPPPFIQYEDTDIIHSYMCCVHGYPNRSLSLSGSLSLSFVNWNVFQVSTVLALAVVKLRNVFPFEGWCACVRENSSETVCSFVMTFQSPLF